MEHIHKFDDPTYGIIHLYGDTLGAPYRFAKYEGKVVEHSQTFSTTWEALEAAKFSRLIFKIV